MKAQLSDTLVKTLPPPPTRSFLCWDEQATGFGIEVTAKGHRSFIVAYRVNGRERRFTIGAFPEWTTTAARKEAQRIRRESRVNGTDPLALIQAAREAPTLADLAVRYSEEHLSKKRPKTQVGAKRMLDNHVLPAWSNKKVSEITFTDVDALHRAVTRRGATYQANRVVALVSKMFNLAIRWGWRADNPCTGIERNPEPPRERYLTEAELAQLKAVLAAHEDQQGVNAIRLLLYTGARSSEVLSATWAQFDLDVGVWVKPSAHTKQKRTHRVPLSEQALELLRGMCREGDYLFPGRGVAHRVDLKKPWAAICKAAKLHKVRIHDLRHAYASVLASSGQSLPVIGALLGHTQPATTARYAHLLDAPLRAATNAAGRAIRNAKPTVSRVK